MSQQMSVDAEILGAASSSDEIRVREYNLQDSKVLTIYSRNRCWKRVRPINSTGPAQWYELHANGNSSLVYPAYRSARQSGVYTVQISRHVPARNQ